MKQKAHSWVALRALKLIEDSGQVPKLSELLFYYLPDVWEGAWIPDSLIVDMGYGHTHRIDSSSRTRDLVGHPGLEPGTSVLSGLRSNQLS